MKNLHPDLEYYQTILYRPVKMPLMICLALSGPKSLCLSDIPVEYPIMKLTESTSVFVMLAGCLPSDVFWSQEVSERAPNAQIATIVRIFFMYLYLLTFLSRRKYSKSSKKFSETAGNPFFFHNLVL